VQRLSLIFVPHGPHRRPVEGPLRVESDNPPDKRTSMDFDDKP
jgi:hypothetical protein